MSGTKYIIYNINTGKPRGFQVRPKGDPPHNLPQNHVCFEGDCDLITDLIINDKITPRPESSITISTSEIMATTGEVKLSNIPSSGAKIRITGNGQSFYRNVTDKSYEFLLDTPGNYVVQCESDVQLPITFNLRVV